MCDYGCGVDVLIMLSDCLCFAFRVTVVGVGALSVCQKLISVLFGIIVIYVVRSYVTWSDANEKTGKRCILAVGLELVYSVSDSSPSSPKVYFNIMPDKRRKLFFSLLLGVKKAVDSADYFDSSPSELNAILCAYCSLWFHLAFNQIWIAHK